ncbi:MAG: family 2 encapsulin nanocompartment cargo protein polyprenyl transferase [Solirubrobacteraceae bacterium]
MIDPALYAAVDRLPPATRRTAAYHFGWRDVEGQPSEHGGGKALRPTLCLLTAAAAGTDPVAALPAAVAVELVHNFSLLHDDIMDGDVRRRHRPTAWTVFGLGPAILAGDALLTAAFETLTVSDHGRAEPSIRELSATVLALVDGQSLDLEFEGRVEVGIAECQRMTEAKTGALMGCACTLGALFADAHPAQVEHVRTFGERLGMAFQLIDDILGIWGDPEVTGKPVFSDLSNRKKSLPVVAALRSDTAAGTELARLYRRSEPLSQRELAHAAGLIEGSGARRWSEAQADEQLAGALEHLHRAGLGGSALDELTALAQLVTTRDN